MTGAGPAEKHVVSFRSHASALVLPAAGALVASGLAGFALGTASGRPRWVAGAVVLVLVSFVARASLLPFLRWWTTTYELTTRRLSMRSGVVSRHGRDLPLHRVVDVALDRSLLQRVVGSGSLLLQTSSTDEPVRLEGVPQPERLYRAMVRLMGESRFEDASRQVAGERPW